MPYKERYWKEPEKYRKEARDRSRALIALGYKSGRKKISSYLRMLEISMLWKKCNREAVGKISKKHMSKVRLITGIGSNEMAGFRLKLMGGMRGHKKSKTAQ